MQRRSTGQDVRFRLQRHVNCTSPRAASGFVTASDGFRLSRRQPCSSVHLVAKGTLPPGNVCFTRFQRLQLSVSLPARCAPRAWARCSFTSRTMRSKKSLVLGSAPCASADSVPRIPHTIDVRRTPLYQTPPTDPMPHAASPSATRYVREGRSRLDGNKKAES